MCGIVGLFLKDKALSPKLGGMLSDMLVTMTDRGPDSAGVAIYGSSTASTIKITVRSQDAAYDFKNALSCLGKDVAIAVNDSHAVLSVPANKIDETISKLTTDFSHLDIMSQGEKLEIYKEVGLPEKVAERFEVQKMGGMHAIGHTRMATESAVTTMGAHPFSTGLDQCLVHNGSLSNNHNLRRILRREGVSVKTENDSEAAAAYLTWKMQSGSSLKEALESSLDDLDGFFTFLVGTKDGFGVVRDPIACKPAVMAETDEYVAFASEYRAFANLPNIEKAKVWEPEPSTVYFWEH